MQTRGEHIYFARFGFLAWPIIALALCHPAGLLAQDSIDVNAVAQDLDAFRKRLSSLRQDIDKSRFEPDEQVDRLDYDAELILDFVSGDIAFHPYEGTLRGAAGTLRARAGNSLDQSLLLGYMLKSAGYDARIVRTELSDTEALGLLRNTGNASVPQSLEYLQTAATTPDGSAGLIDSNLYRDTLAQEQLLLNALADAGVALETIDATERFLAVTRSYFWVQHRDGPSREWQDAHPSFDSNNVPQSLEPKEFFVDTIPKKYHHTFTMSAHIEQWFNGEIRTHLVMQPWTSPAASIVGKALRYRNAPNGLSRETAGDLAKAMDETTILIPAFNDGMAPGAQAFDLNGRPIDPFALSMGGAAGLFQTLGDKLESATEGVAEREDGKPILALHSMYLEFTFTTPSGDTDTRRRYLLPPRTDYGDDNGALWKLITDHTYTVAAGDMPVDYLADRYLDVSTEAVDWLEFTFRKSLDPDEGIPVPAEMSTEVPALTQLWSMRRRPVDDAGIIRFRAFPGLVGIRNGYKDAQTAFIAVDVVANRVEHVRVTESGLAAEARAALRNGVWDTVLESVPARLRHTESISTVSTIDLFKQARGQGISTTVLNDARSTEIDRLGLDENARRFLRDDLERGYVVVTTERVPDGAEMPAWWRIHRASGETLGMTGDGYGQESAEYVVVDILLTGKGLIGAFNSIRECESEPTMVTQLCCLVNAHANNVMGMGIGSYMGTALGAGTAAIWEAANTASQETTGEGLLPSVGPMNCSDLPDADW